MHRLERESLETLLEVLRSRGFGIRGPTVRQGAIVIEEINSCKDLPAGWTDTQCGGHYRLERRKDQALFAHNVGPESWKKFLFPPHRRIWRSQRDGRSLSIVSEEINPPALALLGLRACDLAALAIHDRVFLQGRYVDAWYAAQRQKLFLIAVNCSVAGGSCFCTSMNTGPRAHAGYDIAITELIHGTEHYFLLEGGSDAGREVMSELPTRRATAQESEAAAGQASATSASMKKRLDTAGIKELLQRNSEHPRWEEIARRCLSCANCTMVCPTCFCHNVEDVTDLSGNHAERWRKWDSCFTLDFSYIHGGPVRSSTSSRYRQWLTHKMASWIDQFGTSGCVGCGRCITWCPVGIDLTEEVAAIRESDPFRQAAAATKEEPHHAS